MRVTLIVNPRSGRGAAARFAGTVASMLRAAVPSLVATVTADAAATCRLAAQIAQRGDDVLAVLGGDGTAHLAAQGVAGSSTALAVLPSGTGNDLGAALGIPTDPVAAARHVADALRRGQRRRIDLGSVDGGACFTTVLCTGFDAAVNARANAMRWPGRAAPLRPGGTCRARSTDPAAGPGAGWGHRDGPGGDSRRGRRRTQLRRGVADLPGYHAGRRPARRDRHRRREQAPAAAGALRTGALTVVA